MELPDDKLEEYLHELQAVHQGELPKGADQIGVLKAKLLSTLKKHLKRKTSSS